MAGNLSHSAEYLHYYNMLESAVRQKYNLSIEEVANGPLKHHKEELDTLRHFRNVLNHSKPFGIEFCAEAHVKMVETLKHLIEEVDDTIVYNTCVQFTKICHATMEDRVLPFMNLLHDNVYTHIPILDEKKRVIGVFGESTLFTYVLDHANNRDLADIDENTTFADLGEYTRLDKHETEAFVFVSRYASALECKYEFKKIFNEDSRRRLGMMFITENGRENEALVGLKTAAGMLGREDIEKTQR